jgi:lipopolysaccharide/colanic/teichoic acid biosynthesis glycosyltransferase
MRPTLPLGIRVTATRVETLDPGDTTFNGAYWFDLRTRRPVAAGLKRALDVLGAAAMLSVTAPLIVAMTVFRPDAIVIRRSVGFRGHLFDRYLLATGPFAWLPQLFNVLEGTMSLVGPRPLDPREHRDAHMRRFAVKPGVTGLWRVCEGDPTQLDREYVNRWSIVLDLSVLARSVVRRR